MNSCSTSATLVTLLPLFMFAPRQLAIIGVFSPAHVPVKYKAHHFSQPESSITSPSYALKVVLKTFLNALLALSLLDPSVLSKLAQTQNFFGILCDARFDEEE